MFEGLLFIYLLNFHLQVFLIIQGGSVVFRDFSFGRGQGGSAPCGDRGGEAPWIYRILPVWKATFPLKFTTEIWMSCKLNRANNDGNRDKRETQLFNGRYLQRVWNHTNDSMIIGKYCLREMPLGSYRVIGKCPLGEGALIRDDLLACQCQMHASVHRGWCAPSKAGKFYVFDSQILQFGEYF